MTIENEGAFVGDFEIPYHFPGRYFLTILDLAVQFKLTECLLGKSPTKRQITEFGEAILQGLACTWERAVNGT